MILTTIGQATDQESTKRETYIGNFPISIPYTHQIGQGSFDTPSQVPYPISLFCYSHTLIPPSHILFILCQIPHFVIRRRETFEACSEGVEGLDEGRLGVYGIASCSSDGLAEADHYRTQDSLFYQLSVRNAGNQRTLTDTGSIASAGSRAWITLVIAWMTLTCSSGYQPSDNAFQADEEKD